MFVKVCFVCKILIWKVKSKYNVNVNIFLWNVVEQKYKVAGTVTDILYSTWVNVLEHVHKVRFENVIQKLDISFNLSLIK